MEITDKEIVDILYKYFYDTYDKIIEYIETEDRINKGQHGNTN